MSSIDPLLLEFFLERLQPLGRRLRAEGVVLLDGPPDAVCASYFRRPARARLTAADLASDPADPDRFVDELVRTWQAEGRAALVPLAEPLRVLARAVAEAVGPDDTGGPADDDGGRISRHRYPLF